MIEDELKLAVIYLVGALIIIFTAYFLLNHSETIQANQYNCTLIIVDNETKLDEQSDIKGWALELNETACARLSLHCPEMYNCRYMYDAYWIGE